MFWQTCKEQDIGKSLCKELRGTMHPGTLCTCKYTADKVAHGKKYV